MNYLPRRHAWNDAGILGHYLFALKLAANCPERFTVTDSEGVAQNTPLGEIVLDQLERFEDETIGLFSVNRFQMLPDRLTFEIAVYSTYLTKPVDGYVRDFKTQITRKARAALDLPKNKPFWEPPKK